MWSRPHYAAHVALERRADWLVMAARLVLLRPRLCFPASLEEERAAEREMRETRRQLDARHAVRRPRRHAPQVDPLALYQVQQKVERPIEAIEVELG